jgi:hypothetical protein
VSAEHADLASLELVKLLFVDKMKLNAAVYAVMRKVGPDPIYHSSLTVYSADHPADETLWLLADRPSWSSCVEQAKRRNQTSVLSHATKSSCDLPSR